MRSVVVVLPASMWAMIPMLRIRARRVSVVPALGRLAVAVLMAPLIAVGYPLAAPTTTAS
jgi:hypothetical protein